MVDFYPPYSCQSSQLWECLVCFCGWELQSLTGLTTTGMHLCSSGPCQLVRALVGRGGTVCSYGWDLSQLTSAPSLQSLEALLMYSI